MEDFFLYIVPTPIGNLGDMTYRAVDILKKVDKILVEDSRRAQLLLNHYAITTTKMIYHSYNEHHVTDGIVKELKKGVKIALISDAGTPGIADPAYLLVKKCIENDISITCLPGATALIPALVMSGSQMQHFTFEAFLPHKKGRTKKLQQLALEKRTLILYESPHRLLKTFQDLCLHLGKDRKICVCRELTKKFEEVLRGSIEDTWQYFKTQKIKGEFVLVIESI